MHTMQAVFQGTTRQPHGHYAHGHEVPVPLVCYLLLVYFLLFLPGIATTFFLALYGKLKGEPLEVFAFLSLLALIEFAIPTQNFISTESLILD